MKKLVVLLAVVVASIAANAASFKWAGANVYGPDGTTKYSGTAYLYCDALGSEALSSATVTSGAIASTTFEASATADTAYDFYYVITAQYKGNEVTFKSPTKSATASATGTANIAFGNQQSATQAAGAWGTVPEPTSALLRVLGVAGLARRRRRV